MAFDFPDTSKLLDGHTVINPETGSIYSWQQDPGKWVLLDPSSIKFDFVQRSGDDMYGPIEVTDLTVLTKPEHLINKGYVDEEIKKASNNNSANLGYELLDQEDRIIVITDPSGDGTDGELWVDYTVEQGHVTWRPDTLDDLKEDMAIKFVFDSGTHEAKIDTFYDQNGSTHVMLKETKGDAFVADESVQIFIKKEPYVLKEGDTMTGDLRMIESSRIVFDKPDDGSQCIRANRNLGEDIDLLYLAHSGGTVKGSFDIRLTGNTSYNSLRFKGLSGGDTPLFEIVARGDINFYKDVSLQNQHLVDVADAVNDTDAVPYGQIKRELSDLRDELVHDTGIGSWILDSISNPNIPGAGKFLGLGGGSPTLTPQNIDELRFYKDDNSGNPGSWGWEIGDMITLTDTTDITKRIQYRVNSVPNLVGDHYEIDVRELDHNTNMINNREYQLSRVTFNSIDPDVLDDTYLRLDAGNSPLTGNLQISKVGNFGAGSLKLSGYRDNNNSSAATIAFENSHTGATGDLGYITFYHFGSDSTAYFGFNRNIDLKSHDIYGVSNLKLTNPGSIYSEGNERIKFKTSSNADDGSGIIEIQRPGSTPRRGFTIRGKNAVNIDADILYSYTNSSGGDAINYNGKQADNSSNLATTKYVKDYVDNNVSAGKTDISISRSSTTVTVNSSSGNNGTIASASSSYAGVITSTDKKKLDGMSYKIVYRSGNYFIETA